MMPAQPREASDPLRFPSEEGPPLPGLFASRTRSKLPLLAASPDLLRRSRTARLPVGQVAWRLGVGMTTRVTIGRAVLLGIAYILPTIDAIILRSRNRGRIVAVNLLTGWTIVGWLVALGMAYRWRRRTIQFIPPWPTD
jgi:hypothetical protein